MGSPKTPPRILLIGANGQVGWGLRRILAAVGTVIAASLEGEYGPKLDLGSPESPARRPAYSVFDNTKLRETFGLALPGWRVSLDQCLEDLAWGPALGTCR